MDEKLPVLSSGQDALAQSISGLYDNSLNQNELTDAESNLVGFWELLIQMDKGNEELTNGKPATATS